MQKLYLLEEENQYDVFMNMAIDEVLFMSSASKSFLRIYNMQDKSITVGRCQKLMEDDIEINKKIKLSKNLTRRITGGGAVFHDKGLTFSFISDTASLPDLKNIDKSYFKIHKIIKKALNSLGVDIEFFASNKHEFCGRADCFTTPVNNDLIFNGEKIVGGAQKRYKGCFIHQGEVLLKRLNLSLFDIDELYKKLRLKIMEEFAKSFVCDITEYKLTKEEYDKAIYLSESKYKNKIWIFRL